MKIEIAIKYFENEVKFYESLASYHKGEEVTARIDACKMAVEALKRMQDREDNPYWLRICELADKQRAKGMRTYGKGLEDNPLSDLERLTYLEEELIDGLMYIEHIKAGREVQNGRE